MPYLDRAQKRALASGRLIVGFEGDRLDSELKDALGQLQPAAVILFGRNASEAGAAHALVAELKAFAQARWGRAMLACVDQEGGPVARIVAGATTWPSMRQLGAHRDGQLAYAFGQALGQEVRAMGFDVNFAPVLDVDSRADSPIIGQRALHSDPQVVASLGARVVDGLQSAQVAACGKHFPGHGDTDVDSHLGLPRLAHPLARLQQVEWPPFAAASAVGLSSIMSAHVVVEALDAAAPATLSAAALGQPLRQMLGFTGVIIADDVEMRAIAADYSLEQTAHMGCRAGVDMFLVCRQLAAAMGLYRALVIDMEAQGTQTQRAEAAAARAGAWAARWHQPVGPAAALRQVAGCAEHQMLARRIAAGA